MAKIVLVPPTSRSNSATCSSRSLCTAELAGANGPMCLFVAIPTPATRPTTHDTIIAAPTAMTREACPIWERPTELVIAAIVILVVAVVEDVIVALVPLAVEIVALVPVVVSVLLVSDTLLVSEVLTVLVPVVVSVLLVSDMLTVVVPVVVP